MFGYSYTLPFSSKIRLHFITFVQSSWSFLGDGFSDAVHGARIHGCLSWRRQGLGLQPNLKLNDENWVKFNSKTYESDNCKSTMSVKKSMIGEESSRVLFIWSNYLDSFMKFLHRFRILFGVQFLEKILAYKNFRPQILIKCRILSRSV